MCQERCVQPGRSDDRQRIAGRYGAAVGGGERSPTAGARGPRGLLSGALRSARTGGRSPADRMTVRCGCGRRRAVADCGCSRATGILSTALRSARTGGRSPADRMTSTVRLWEAASGRQLRVLEGHGDDVRSVAFSPDGRTIASGSDDKTVRLWEAASGRQLRVLEGHGGGVLSVAFSPDGRTIASGAGALSWVTVTIRCGCGRRRAVANCGRLRATGTGSGALRSARTGGRSPADRMTIRCGCGRRRAVANCGCSRATGYCQERCVQPGRADDRQRIAGRYGATVGGGERSPTAGARGPRGCCQERCVQPGRADDRQRIG